MKCHEAIDKDDLSSVCIKIKKRAKILGKVEVDAPKCK